MRGVTRQIGNEIDEFVTEALRNNLLGLPLDLAAINIARGRDTGVPSLNEARARVLRMHRRQPAQALHELGRLRRRTSSTRRRWSTSSPPTARTPAITAGDAAGRQARGGRRTGLRRRRMDRTATSATIRPPTAWRLPEQHRCLGERGRPTDGRRWRDHHRRRRRRPVDRRPGREADAVRRPARLDLQLRLRRRRWRSCRTATASTTWSARRA